MNLRNSQLALDNITWAVSFIPLLNLVIAEFIVKSFDINDPCDLNRLLNFLTPSFWASNESSKIVNGNIHSVSSL